MLPPMTVMERLGCKYRGTETRRVECKPCQNSNATSLPVYNCAAFGDECVIHGYPRASADDTLRVCLTCKQRTRSQAVRVRTDASLFDHANRPVRLANAHRDGYLFVVGGGPSLLDVPKDGLSQRGVVTLGLNNSPATVKPTLWISMDPASKFLESTWRDSTIQKFVPYFRRNETTRRRDASGQLVNDRHVHQHPNVLYYKQSQGDFDPKTFLSSSTFHWGCANGQRDPDGTTGVRSVMLPAIKLAYYLGFSTVFFVGCDFRMTEQKPYSFDQTASADRVRSNNGLYRVMTRRIELLRPVLADAGMRLINTTPNSRLGSVLENWSLARALDVATRAVRSTDTRGMY